MDALLSHGTRDDLHRPRTAVPPAEQAIGSQRPVILARCVERHFDDAFDVAIGRREGADVEPQAAGYRRADLPGVELLAFDFAALGAAIVFARQRNRSRSSSS
jgi:hypothetical protein